MSVLVDTSIWSAAFRKGHGGEVRELERLIRGGQARLLGAVRQETLQGYRDPSRFEAVRQRLAVFPNFPLEEEDYARAASFFNLCRGKGIQGSNTDFLICAVSARHGLAIFSADKDFQRFSRHLTIKLHDPGS